MKHSIINKRIYYFLGILSILLIWLILSYTQNDFLVPKISVVLKDIGDLLLSSETWLIILTTILKLFIAVTFSYLISLIIGILSYKYYRFRSFISPIIAMMRSIPVASFVIILLLIIGTRLTPIIITMFVIIPIASESVYASFLNIDKDIMEETKLISNINLNIIFKIMIPISFRYLLSSILTSVGLGLKVLVMSEVITQGPNTIGGKLQLARTLLESPRVFSWTIVLIIMILLIELLIKKCEKSIIYNV